jgi:cell division protein FtsI (penicillin-binding protein 3)
MSRRRLDGFLLIEGRKRLVFLSVGLAFLFSLLLIQFYRIQIVEGEKWEKKALAQHQLRVVEPCRRGSFYSNTSIKEGHPEDEVPFVVDVEKSHLYADVVSIPEGHKSEVIEKVTSILALNNSESENLKVQLGKKSRSRKLVLWMDQEKRKEIESWWFPFARMHKIPRNALYFIQDYKRSYPYGKMLGQILHTVREIRDPKTHKQIPTGGLELSLQSYLQGKEGKRVFLRSPRNPLDFGTVVVPPEDGADVYLTINHYLQAVAEEEIAKAVETAGSKNGWAIMMEPNTGEILAWAQYPSFDPSSYRTFFNDPKLQERAEIKGIIEPFEPASIMKPITMAICFKANEELKKRGEPPLFSPHEKVATSNGTFPGRSRPIKDVRLHYYLNMYMALQKSSNIYMARMVQRIIERLGDDWYRASLQDLFGFGLKTGIELPSESIGLLPSPHKKHPNGALEWSKPTPYSISFGHNILASSLQMLKAYAVLCNGGYNVQPHLVKKIVKTHRSGEKEVLLNNEKDLTLQNKKPLISSEFLQEVLKGMMYVTKFGGGGKRADIFGYTEAGKTGTSEKVVNGTYSKKDHISSFLGFCPALNPRFVLMVVIDEPAAKVIPGFGRNQYGGICAAPAFREIGRKTLEYLGVEPDDPFGFPVGDPRRNPSKAVWGKETEMLKDLYDSWNGKK